MKKDRISLKYCFIDDIRNPKDAWIYPRRDEKKQIITGRSLENISGIPNGNWDIVRTYDQFVDYLEKNGIPDVISFDHDLSDEMMRYYHVVTSKTGEINYEDITTKSGLCCAKYLAAVCLEQNKKFPIWYVHSANKWGASNIKNYITDFLEKYPQLQTLKLI